MPIEWLDKLWASTYNFFSNTQNFLKNSLLKTSHKKTKQTLLCNEKMTLIEFLKNLDSSNTNPTEQTIRAHCH